MAEYSPTDQSPSRSLQYCSFCPPPPAAQPPSTQPRHTPPPPHLLTITFHLQEHPFARPTAGNPAGRLFEREPHPCGCAGSTRCEKLWRSRGRWVAAMRWPRGLLGNTPGPARPRPPPQPAGPGASACSKLPRRRVRAVPFAVSPDQRAWGRVARERPLLGEASSCLAAAPASPAPLSAEVAAFCPGLRRALCIWQFQVGRSPGAERTCFQPALGRPSRGGDGGEGPRGAGRAKWQAAADMPALRGRK